MERLTYSRDSRSAAATTSEVESSDVSSTSKLTAVPSCLLAT